MGGPRPGHPGRMTGRVASTLTLPADAAFAVANLADFFPKVSAELDQVLNFLALLFADLLDELLAFFVAGGVGDLLAPLLALLAQFLPGDAQFLAGFLDLNGDFRALGSVFHAIGFDFPADGPGEFALGLDGIGVGFVELLNEGGDVFAGRIFETGDLLAKLLAEDGLHFSVGIDIALKVFRQFDIPEGVAEPVGKALPRGFAFRGTDRFRDVGSCFLGESSGYGYEGGGPREGQCLEQSHDDMVLKVWVGFAFLYAIGMPTFWEFYKKMMCRHL